MRQTTTKLTALVLALSLLLSSCGGGASATSMHLRKTQGTVGVSDNEGKNVEPKDNLGLYSGYQVGTQAESYAWIDLDKVKLTKLDADSEIEIAQEGKKLEINVKSGSLFFNITEPLAGDETMDIATSTMVIGIRGTCGWVGENTAALLEGTVEVTAGDQTATVSAGEMAVLTPEGTLEVKSLTAASVPVFVREELEADEDLAAAILEASNIDLGEDSVYPLHVVTSKKVFLPDGTLVYHETIEYDEFGYATRDVSTHYYTENGRKDTDVWNYTNNLEAGTQSITTASFLEDGSLVEGTVFTTEVPLVLGESKHTGIVAEPSDNFISCVEGNDWVWAESRANGGRYEFDTPLFTKHYFVYSYGDEGNRPVSSVTYTADGVMTGYAEFEWAVIDP